MDIVAIQRYEMLVRVKAFSVAPAEVLPPTSLAAQTFTVVATAVDALQAQMTEQASGSRGDALRAKASARQAVRAAVHSISRAAQAIGMDTPGVVEKFREATQSGGPAADCDGARVRAERHAVHGSVQRINNLPSNFGLRSRYAEAHNLSPQKIAVD